MNLLFKIAAALGASFLEANHKKLRSFSLTGLNSAGLKLLWESARIITRSETSLSRLTWSTNFEASPLRLYTVISWRIFPSSIVSYVGRNHEISIKPLIVLSFVLLDINLWRNASWPLNNKSLINFDLLKGLHSPTLIKETTGASYFIIFLPFKYEIFPCSSH